MELYYDDDESPDLYPSTSDPRSLTRTPHLTSLLPIKPTKRPTTHPCTCHSKPSTVPSLNATCQSHPEISRLLTSPNATTFAVRVKSLYERTFEFLDNNGLDIVTGKPIHPSRLVLAAALRTGTAATRTTGATTTTTTTTTRTTADGGPRSLSVFSPDAGVKGMTASTAATTMTRRGRGLATLAATLEEQLEVLHQTFMAIIEESVMLVSTADAEFLNPRLTRSSVSTANKTNKPDSSSSSSSSSSGAKTSKGATAGKLGQDENSGEVLRRALKSRQGRQSSGGVELTPNVQRETMKRLANLPALTEKEAKRIRAFFKHLEMERKKGPEHLEKSGLWRPPVKTLQDWIREKYDDTLGKHAAEFFIKTKHKSSKETTRAGASATAQSDSIASQDSGSFSVSQFIHDYTEMFREEDEKYEAIFKALGIIGTVKVSQPALMQRGKRQLLDVGALAARRPSHRGTIAVRRTLSEESSDFTSQRRMPSSAFVSITEDNEPEPETKRMTALEILAYPTRDYWNMFHKECVSFLQIPPKERTRSEITLLQQIMRKLSAFDGLSDFIVREVCQAMYYQKLERDRVVFRQGDPALAWYIIMSGSVDIQVSTSGDVVDNRSVKMLYAGEGFGEVGLVNNGKRTGTIITAEPCELVIVQKDDYNRVLRFIHQKNITEIANFLRSVPMFHDWSLDSRRSVAQHMLFRTVKPGETITRESANCNEFYFVKSGTVELFKTIQVPDGGKTKPKSICVGTRGEKEYFGEEGILFGNNDGAAHKFRFTARAQERNPSQDETFPSINTSGPLTRMIFQQDTDSGNPFPQNILPRERKSGASGKPKGVVLAVMTSYNARKWIQNLVQPSPLLSINDNEVMEIYRETQEKLVWKRFKRAHIKLVMKELKGAK